MLAEREGLTRTILEAFKSRTLYGGKVGTRRSLRPRPQELGYIFSMGYKIYVERNALRLWIWDLKRQGKIQLVLFPYDGRNPAGVQLATPSVVTCDSTWVTWDMTIPISDMVGSDKFEQIRQILRLENEKKIMAPAGLIGEKTEGDARHLDSAYKSGCRAFLTTDKRTILRHRAQLEALLGFQLYHPDEHRAAFVTFLNGLA